MHGNTQHVAFDFMSSVIDFTVISSPQSTSSDTNHGNYVINNMIGPTIAGRPLNVN